MSVIEPPHAPLCVITNHPARYRDTKTGLPYYNAYAYKEIQRLIKGDFKWSKLLGTWVGNGSDAAKGVPDRFLRPETAEERKERLERKEQEKKLAEQEKEKADEAAKATEIKEETSTPGPAVDTNTIAPPVALAPSQAPEPAFVLPSMPPPVSAGIPTVVPSPDEKMGAPTPVASGPATSTTPATPSAPGTSSRSEQQVGQQVQPAPTQSQA